MKRNPDSQHSIAPTQTSNANCTTYEITTKIGSDEYMIARGFRRSTPDEIARYGKFCKHEGIVSIIRGLFARWQNKSGVSVSSPKSVILSTTEKEKKES